LIAGWPETLRMQVPELGEVLFVTPPPRNDTEMFTRLTSEDVLAPIFDPLNVPLVVCGHTHMQFDRTIGATRVVNAGSVGMPFQNRAPIGCYWDPAFSFGRRRTISRKPPNDSKHEVSASRGVCRTQRSATPVRGRDAQRFPVRIEVAQRVYCFGVAIVVDVSTANFL
jgi:diadenosine tetraphosphatase ApaH/serine/threonine PP2A family protein phosphatase